MKVSEWIVCAVVLLGALWWWRKRERARTTPVGLSTGAAVAVLASPAPAAQKAAVGGAAASVMRAAALPPVGLGISIPTNLVQGSVKSPPPPPAAPAPPATQLKVPASQPAPKRPTGACTNGKAWVMRKVAGAKTASNPSGIYNQWQCG